MSEFNIYRNGKIHVCAEECETCVFRKGNLMHLHAGRLKGMVDAAVRNQSTIVCHKTLDGDNAACRGFFDRHRTTPLQLAERLNMIEYVDPHRRG